MKALTIAGNELLRFLRAPITLALGLVLPLLLVLLAGLGNSRATASVALVVADDGPLATELADSIRAIDDLAVTDLDRDDMLKVVARSDVAAGVLIPDRYDQMLRSGQQVDVEYLSAAAANVDVAGLIDAEVAAVSSRVRAATFATSETGVSFDDALAAATSAADGAATTDVRLVGPGGEEPEDPTGAFDEGAVNMILLFVFITAVASSAMIIDTRRLGVGRRMLSTPTRALTVITGAAIGRFLISAVQSAIIVVVSALAFGVDWGNPLAALTVLALFSLVGAGAGLLAGSLFTSEAMAYGVGIGLGIGLLYLSLIDTYSAFSPIRWAWGALDELMKYHGTMADITTELGVLAMFAAVLLALSTWRFRAAITDG